MGTGVTFSLWAPGKIYKSIKTEYIKRKEKNRLQIVSVYIYSFSQSSINNHIDDWKKGNQASRQISNGTLNALLHLHFHPIKVVVFDQPLVYLCIRDI